MSAGRGGFTLIELMVALVVGGLVVAAAQQGLATVSDARARAEAVRAPVARAAGARDLVTTWLRNAVQPRDARAFLEAEAATPGESDVVTFVVNDGGALFPGRRRIRLWVDTRSTSPRVGLLAEVSGRRGEPWAADTLLLEENAGVLDVRYWGMVDGVDRWVDTWASDETLPKVVEVRLEPVRRVRLGPGGTADVTELQSLLRLPIVVPLGMGEW